MTARYHVGWFDFRGVFSPNRWGTTPKDPLYEEDFFRTVEYIKTVNNVEMMNIGALIGLWTVRFGEVVPFTEIEDARDNEFIFLVGRRLHKLGYLKTDVAMATYTLNETPHNLGNTHHGDN